MRALTLTCFLLFTVVGAQVCERRVIPTNASTRQTSDKQVEIGLLVGEGNDSLSTGPGALKYPAPDVETLSTELERQGYAVRKLRYVGK